MDDWLAADWPAPPGVMAGTTLRAAGDFGAQAASRDDGAARQGLAMRLGCSPTIGWLQQVHGTTVLALRDEPALTPADASWTTQPGLGCAVLTADCLPVLFASVDGRVVGAAHAGWRGLCAGVLEATVAALRVATAEPLQAWLGPAIGPQSFEVGPEVRAAFIAVQADAAGAFQRGTGDRWWGDLYTLARQRLVHAGVAAQRVYGGGLCTLADAHRFHSYRRDAAAAGRMASVIRRSAGCTPTLQV